MSALEQFLAVPAFASWIEGYRFPDHQTRNSRLVVYIEDRRRHVPGIQASNHLGWHSPRDFFDLDDSARRTLQGHVRTAVTSAARRY